MSIVPLPLPAVPSVPTRFAIPIALAIVAAGALFVRLEGHDWTCTCGWVSLWTNDVTGVENSQQIFDLYTPTHIIHGMLFFFGLWILFGRWPLSVRWLLAITGETIWEAIENAPAMIERYRTQTVSGDYFGDSVINSTGDVAAMAFGFWLAAQLPTWAVVALAVAMEIVLAFLIRDNLALNVLMLIWPLEAVRQWQAGV